MRTSSSNEIATREPKAQSSVGRWCRTVAIGPRSTGDDPPRHAAHLWNQRFVFGCFATEHRYQTQRLVSSSNRTRNYYVAPIGAGLRGSRMDVFDVFIRDFVPAVNRVRARTHAGVAIVAAAIIDEQLLRALLTKMRPLSAKLRKRLFEGYGPLSSFAAKIDLSNWLILLDLLLRRPPGFAAD
jgi:hypothetical protein